MFLYPSTDWVEQTYATLVEIDHAIISWFRRHGHRLHRVSLGVIFMWFGLLKPLGQPTTTSILANTVFWGPPELIVLILGWWEVIIGVCLIIRPLVRAALFLLALRLPGIILAFLLEPDICFISFPFVPTPEGQYLIKDLAIFCAAIAIASSVRDRSTPEQYH